jgi:hypothetical protein
MERYGSRRTRLPGGFGGNSARRRTSTFEPSHAAPAKSDRGCGACAPQPTVTQRDAPTAAGSFANITS